MHNSTISLLSPSILSTSSVISDKIINKQCVACLSAEKNLMAISDDVSAEFLYLANVEVNKEEFICSKCMIQLTSSCHFKRQCLFSHQKIKPSISIIKDSNSSTVSNGSELKIISSSKKNNVSESTNPFVIPSKIGNRLPNTKSTEQIEYIKKGRLPSLKKDKAKFISEQQISSKKSKIENNKSKKKRSKSVDNVANYYGKVCREVFSKMDTFKKYKSQHFSQLTNLFINELGPIKNKENGTSGVCSSCGKMFNQLNKHILVCPCIKRKGKKLCHQCGKVLTDLSKHKCTPEHSAAGTKTFPCDKCGKTFNNYKSLWSHKKIVHSNNKTEFKCVNCPKSYSTASGRREHTLTKHGSGSLPHSCVTCRKDFVSTTKLKRHVTTHNNNPLAFECFICLASFTKTTDLARHMKSEHNNIFRHPDEGKQKLAIKS